MTALFGRGLCAEILSGLKKDHYEVSLHIQCIQYQFFLDEHIFTFFPPYYLMFPLTRFLVVIIVSVAYIMQESFYTLNQSKQNNQQ